MYPSEYDLPSARRAADIRLTVVRVSSKFPGSRARTGCCTDIAGF